MNLIFHHAWIFFLVSKLKIEIIEAKHWTCFLVDCSKKYQHLVGVLKSKWMNFVSVNFVYLKNMLIWTRLWRFVLLITYMLTQEYCFC